MDTESTTLEEKTLIGTIGDYDVLKDEWVYYRVYLETIHLFPLTAIGRSGYAECFKPQYEHLFKQCYFRSYGAYSGNRDI